MEVQLSFCLLLFLFHKPVDKSTTPVLKSILRIIVYLQNPFYDPSKRCTIFVSHIVKGLFDVMITA